MNGKDKSVHLEDYPKANTKLINKEIEQQMQTTRDIVSTALRERDKAHIGIKWPLANATIKSEIKPSEELNKVIKEELNIKKLTYKKSKELEITLDTNMTPELEAEGFAREISRKIQATRKKVGLIKSDEIELEISSDFDDKLENQLELIKERVGAKTISLEKSGKKFSHSEEGKIKGKPFTIAFNKL